MRARIRAALEVLVVAGIGAGLVWLVTLTWLPVSVAGGSMRPTLAPGDVVVVKRSELVRAGGIALLDSARHGRVLHRVVSRSADGSIRTRGDANPVDDLDAVPATGVVGQVVLVAPFGRVLDRWRAAVGCVTIAAQQNNAKR